LLTDIVLHTNAMAFASIPSREIASALQDDVSFPPTDGWAHWLLRCKVSAYCFKRLRRSMRKRFHDIPGSSHAVMRY